MRKLSWAFILFIETFVFANISHAADSLYDVEVYVDVTADSASEAKQKAMTQANRTAFNSVTKKITTDEDYPVLEALNDDQILNFIKEVSIKSEKSSNVRYIANLKVKINEEILKQYMQEKEISPAFIENTKILIIPTFREFKTDSPMLWEANNIWRSGWEEESANQDDVVTFTSIVPNGSNYASLDAQKALSLNKTALDQVAFNNNVSNIYVVDAVYNGIEGLTVNIISYQDGSTEVVEIYGERTPQLIIDSIGEVKKSIINKLKHQSIEENSQRNVISVIYNYRAMSEWIKIEKKLREINAINNIKIVAMTSGKVQFDIDFTGPFNKLEQTLNNHFFKLTDQGEIYLLERY